MSINRYIFTSVFNDYMMSDRGDWVKYIDYLAKIEKLKAQVDLLENRLAIRDDDFKVFMKDKNDLHSKYVRTKAQKDELVKFLEFIYFECDHEDDVRIGEGIEQRFVIKKRYFSTLEAKEQV